MIVVSIVLSLVAGFMIAWGNNLATLAMDRDRSAKDRRMFLAIAVLLISVAIFGVVLYVS